MVPGEELYLYFSTIVVAVLAALVQEEEKVQHPVYYTSRALRGAEPRYPPMKLLAFALVELLAFALELLYFQAHPIKVLTEALLKMVLQCLDVSEFLVNWSIELSEFDINYVPQTTFKGQALADFISEMTRPCKEDPIPSLEGQPWCVGMTSLESS